MLELKSPYCDTPAEAFLMSDARSYTVCDRQLKCSHCGGLRFRHKIVRLNTQMMPFFDFMEWDSSADAYGCVSCGQVMWFASDLAGALSTADEVRVEDTALGRELQKADGHLPVALEEMEVTELPEPTECLSCNAMIPASVSACPKCGWSYLKAEG